MATKSINLSRTTLVRKQVITVAIGVIDDICHNYELTAEVENWLILQKISYKFNTRKGRIKFNNEPDAIYFTLMWL